MSKKIPIIDELESESSDDESSMSQLDSLSTVDDDLDIDDNDNGWRKWSPNDIYFNNIPFTADYGYKPPINMPQTELDYFQLFFSNELLEEIVLETNRYAVEKIQKTTPLRQHSIWWNWIDATIEEMKAFLGVIMNMALNEKPSIFHYFSDEWTSKQPFFKDVFSRKRFLQLYWAFHVNPPPAGGLHIRGSKVKNVVDYIDNKCRQYYIPGQNIAVDASTVGFKGRIIFKMYNPQKPTKWVLRVYVLAESTTGYISAITPYYGASTTTTLPRPDLSFTARITLHLCHKLLAASNGSGYHLFTHRFYTGVELAQELLQINIHTTGTIIPNRKRLPEVIRKKKLTLRKFAIEAYRKNDEMMVLLWKDKRNVYGLSTFHNHASDRVTRKLKIGEVEEISKPIAIINYTNNMGAVDRADHYIASYGFTRKSLKWWRKMFFWLLEVGIVNSYILCNKQKEANGEKIQSHLNYRQALLNQLIGSVRNSNPRKRGRPATVDEEERLNKRPHFIFPNENSNSKDCAVCSNRKVAGGRRETIFYCDTCSRKPRLHPGQCFKRYHTEKIYK